jgi:RHH-type proline utilization regulon transcriptional repressor/proline dehydrogenase/delta 1-pyrroline-5-carboxylate dehydrogenase
MHTELEQSIQNEGRELFKAIQKGPDSLFDKQYWLGRIMEWVMKDPSFKVDLFRFVDVLPALVTKDQIAKHIQEYLLKKDRELPQVIGGALKAASFSFARGLAASAIRKNVTEMAARFIAGSDIKNASKALLKLHDEGFTTTIDLLGEKVLSSQESDIYFERYQEIIAQLPGVSLPHQANVSIKISALSCHLHEEDPDFSIKSAKERVLPLMRLAKFHKVFINFDLESYQTSEIINQLFHDLILSDEYRTSTNLGIVVQAYLKNSHAYLSALLESCKIRKAPITIRLVKGAYWDYEVIRAEQRGIDCPVFKHKADTDQNFERLSKIMLDNSDLIRPAFGSHNIRSLSHVLAYAKKKNIGPKNFEIQMLYGMAEAERKAFLERGYNVRIYVPIGDTLVGMSYLVRRLLENTSQMGFLKLSHHDQVASDILLAPPVLSKNISQEAPRLEFHNASYLDFSKKVVREDFVQALRQAQNLLPMKVGVFIAGEELKTDHGVEHMSPNNTQQIAAIVMQAHGEAADQALAHCVEIFPKLRSQTPSERAVCLRNLAHILHEDRYELAALMCHEVGKTWAEADADVVEAIDFCNYYAQRAPLELDFRSIGSMSGEDNSLGFQGRGPTVVIAPWNFPLAILCGMSVGAYVAGNPVIMKPAEQSSLTALYLYQRMLKAGFLAQALHFLPGRGEEIGAYLCEHPLVANICFTGSKKVGLEILKRAQNISKKQPQLKRVICEMGGKNAFIIDDDADLDEAVLAVIASAFGYAGQKCSAASRVLVIGNIKDIFIKRLTEAADSLVAGSSLLPKTQLGPVINAEAFDRLNLKIIDLQVDPSVIIWHRGENLKGGYFIPPVIVEVKDPHHWVMQEELFGPILALHAVSDLKQAVAVANMSIYALTGAFFSRSPENIAYAKAEFNVGNLYINQKCTGAAVGRQPFGGFKMSGTGPKAGGPHYLLNLSDARSICENTMRRGFIPEI